MALPIALKKSKQILKNFLHAARRSYIGTFQNFNAAELEAALAKLGVVHGQSVLIHSSFDAFEGFSGKPSDVVKVLENLVGSSGTILMPSIPFTNTAIEYVKSGKITDIARTPSRNGLLTEVFRRQKGTLRSLHPTHPVLARGAHAVAMLADHHLAKTPCGEGSPFAKILQERGKILLLGTPIEAMTFFHYLEERYEDRFELSPFTAETFDVPVKKGTETVVVRMRLFDPIQSRRRSVRHLLPELRRLGGCSSGKVGVLNFLLIDTVVALKAFESCLEDGIQFYE